MFNWKPGKGVNDAALSKRCGADLIIAHPSLREGAGMCSERDGKSFSHGCPTGKAPAAVPYIPFHFSLSVSFFFPFSCYFFLVCPSSESGPTRGKTKVSGAVCARDPLPAL